MDEYDDDDDLSSPLLFKEVLGEHTLTENVRMAFIWAAQERFLTEEEHLEVDETDFTAAQKQLAKSVVFHGPFLDMAMALDESLRRRGVVVAYVPSWTKENQPTWLVCLAH